MQAKIQWVLSLLFGLTIYAPAIATVPSKYSEQSDEWFRSDEGRKIANNVLSWQSSSGSWPKNKDTASKRCEEKPEKLKGTFDNGATISELRFLARAASLTEDPSCRAAVLKGIDLLLQAQYPTGGWPQKYPPSRGGYDRHITFNDGTMIRIMEFMRDLGSDAEFQWIDEARRAAAAKAFERGVECILACQIVVKGKRTVWCAQHDEVSLEPRPARAYELVSLSGSESAGIIKFLMTLRKPSDEVRRAIDEGVAWFDSAKIVGKRIDSRDDDTRIVDDPSSGPIWARFYEIDTNRPFFCGRDGVVKYDLSEVEQERRGGYAWYGDWGVNVLKQYEKWQKREKKK